MISAPPTAAGAAASGRVLQLTWRAVLTGMALGGGFAICNIYVGLKIGWGLGMSIPGALLGFGIWRLLALTRRTTGLSIFEVNINQTAASAAAAISSAGLVAPIPALTMITGQTLSWGLLVVWTFSVCLVGIVVAVALRRQMIEVEQLTFPSGVATGETLKEIYAHGKEAMARMWMLAGGAVLAAIVKLAEHIWKIPRLAWPGKLGIHPGSALEATGHKSITLGNLGFAFEPTTLMYAIGVIIGPRVGVSLLIGSLIAWGWLAPLAFHSGWTPPGPVDPERSWFHAGVQWLLWPGVALMVASALTSFAFSWRSILNTFRPSAAAADQPAGDDQILPRNWFFISLVMVMAMSVVLQVTLFAIDAWIAALGVLLTFVLALVAARVSGETGITPVGAMGKVTQLFFALLSPGQPAANLMAANVTGGAASQCADLMHDLKTGHMIGANPRYQFVAQIAGALAGALAGCAGYLLLIPDPKNQLLTDQWPAPAVATWKAVAELFMRGVQALPPGAAEGMILGCVAGIALAVLEKTLPKKARVWIPSAPSLGLGFVIPAFNAISLFLGATAGWALGRRAPNWSQRFLIVGASGLIAGESLLGVVLALEQMLAGR